MGAEDGDDAAEAVGGGWTSGRPPLYSLLLLLTLLPLVPASQTQRVLH